MTVVAALVSLAAVGVLASAGVAGGWAAGVAAMVVGVLGTMVVEV
jgi:hypothetical protein